jgi:hypothetical protein
MKIENEFRVSAPLEEAWAVLTDIPTIAPCMPGATLTSVEDDAYTGKVKIKVGPVTADYEGKATFVSKDDATHRAELSAKGRDSRGSGNAQALIVAQLTGEGETTFVRIDTDLKVSGKVAQFGRGVMVDVSTKLIAEFVECLEGKFGDEEEAGADTDTELGGLGQEEAEALDLMEYAGGAVGKRVLPVVAVGVLALLLWLIVRGRRPAP